MDTLKFLLGVTVALLIGAIALSWQSMKDGVKNASPEELAQLQQQIDELRKEVEQSKAKPQEPSVASEEVEEIKQQLAATRQQLERVEAEKAAEMDDKLKQDEEGLIAQKMLEKNDSELRRARIIAQALLIGRVKEVVEDPQYGGFITIEVLMPEQVQVGTVLGIRRKTGILATFKVSDVTDDGAIANPVTALGPVKPESGDELVFPPQY